MNWQKLEAAIEAILQVLGEPQNGWQHQAFDEYKEGDDAAVKITAASALDDPYCRCLAYLVATKPNSDLYKILISAANAAAEHAQKRTLQKLGDFNAFAFQSESPLAEIIIEVLGVLSRNAHETEVHQEAFEAFGRRDFQTVKELTASNLDDSLLRSMAYLSSLTNPSAELPTIAAEASRAAADYVRQATLKKLSPFVGAAVSGD